MSQQDFLLEIGCEELPHHKQQTVINAFSQQLTQILGEEGIRFDSQHTFATPRRLAVIIKGISETQQDQNIEKKGPSVANGFDASGNPTKALQGFCQSVSATPEELDRIDTEKGQWLVYKGVKKGKKSQELLPKLIEEAWKKIPLGKCMIWTDQAPAFPRPVRWVCALWGKETLPLSLFGLESCHNSFGHRILAPDAVSISSPSDYESTLKKAFVIANYDARKEEISQQIKAFNQTDYHVIDDEDLLDEVTGLVEWPQVMQGNFHPDFLQLPKEVLMTSMKKNQKYFSIESKKNELVPSFLTVSNINSTDKEQCISGYETVLTARLQDAVFFYEQDTKQKIDHFLHQQKRVTFQKGLGSIFDKTLRLEKIMLALSGSFSLQTSIISQAALWSKFDLLTDMVTEFTSLQGTIGGIYAKHFGADSVVSDAIAMQYYPRFSGDTIPNSPLGQLLALTDKADTLIGLFSVGKIPSGTKDPYSLRRSALGIIRILVEGEISLTLESLFQTAANHYPAITEKTVSEAILFCQDRYQSYLLDQNKAITTIKAVLAVKSSPWDQNLRLRALESMQESQDLLDLASANKRMVQILKKHPAPATPVDTSLFESNEEQTLWNISEQLYPQLAEALAAQKYQDALKLCSQLKAPVDAFFDQVLVISEEINLQQNRLALIEKVAQLCCSVCSLDQLVETQK